MPDAKIIQKMKGKQQVLFETKMNGLYQIALPCDAQSLLVEAKGYRSQILPLNIIEKSENGSFCVPVTLVSIDKQASDQPYFQTDQRHTTLKENKAGKEASTTRMFEITDALTGKHIPAELCLFYTKAGVKDCQNIKAGSAGYETVFREADIIAIEVKSVGYQNYFGNLIMDKLDGKKSNYQIRLSRAANVLTVMVNSDFKVVKCQLIGAKSVELSSFDGIHFFTNVSPETNYTLQVNDNTGLKLATKTFFLKEGINFYAWKMSPKTAVKPTETPLVIQSAAFDNSKRVLYFSKSDYQLREENKLRLDSLAAWLRSDPGHFLKITGHTDNVGPAHLNLTLSEYRAKVAYYYLLQKGADPGKMKYTGAGSNAPDAANDVETNKIKNRRVEIQLLRNP